VALSLDASTLAIGAPWGNNYMGYVKVYYTDNNGGNRVQLGQTIYGNATGDYFGWSVDITADGMTIIGGSTWFLGNVPGYASVFTLEVDDDVGTSTWNQIGQDIIGEANGDEFGNFVSISEDGKTIAVGARYNDGNNKVDSGHIRIYHLKEDDGTRWEQINQDINGDTACDGSGWSVSLSADGTMVAIGSPYIDGSESGQVRVYQIDSQGSSWEQLWQDMYGDNMYDSFGESVNLSPDGNTIAIGSPGYYTNDVPGYVRVFTLEIGDDVDTSSWKQIGRDIFGEANRDRFGRSVSLSDDGTTLAVGAQYNNGSNGVDSGHVRVYQTDANSKSGWMQLGNDIDGEAADDMSGSSVFLSADGNTVAISSPWNNDNGDMSGHVRVFVLG
jgi:hypothetical protein